LRSIMKKHFEGFHKMSLTMWKFSVRVSFSKAEWSRKIHIFKKSKASPSWNADGGAGLKSMGGLREGLLPKTCSKHGDKGPKFTQSDKSSEFY
jgi:hypothetical protein